MVLLLSSGCAYRHYDKNENRTLVISGKPGVAAWTKDEAIQFLERFWVKGQIHEFSFAFANALNSAIHLYCHLLDVKFNSHKA